MTYTSPELIPTPAESLKHAGLPAGSRHLKPDGASRDARENTREDTREDTRHDTKDAFELQFSRSRRLLFFLARRILNCVQEAEEAVKNCRLTASRNPPGFSSEGAFKSWLVRILIDEATLLLRRRQSNSTAPSENLPEAR
jgi:DNA-directed RNA polymerase specialized sigma24 family protein